MSSIAGHLQSLELAPVLLDGFELAEVLYRQVNPGADEWPADVTELLAEPMADIEVAAARADELRQLFCQSQVDDRRSHTSDRRWLGGPLSCGELGAGSHLARLAASPDAVPVSVHAGGALAGGAPRHRAPARQASLPADLGGAARSRDPRASAGPRSQRARSTKLLQLTDRACSVGGRRRLPRQHRPVRSRHPDGNATEPQRGTHASSSASCWRAPTRGCIFRCSRSSTLAVHLAARRRPAAAPPPLRSAQPRGHHAVDRRSVRQPGGDAARLGATRPHA